MRRMLLVAPFLVAACAAQTGQPVSIHSVPPGSKCIQSSVFDTYVGRPASAELAPRLMSASTARVLRWVPHGSAVTMDYRAERLTVWLDANNRIERLSCG